MRAEPNKKGQLLNWRKWITSGILILVCGGVLYSLRIPIIFFLFTPIVDFKADKIPAAPDYTNLKSWAMHPGKDGGGAAAPDRLRVFWIHPTTYRSPLQWNEDPSDAAATDRFSWTRERQVSIFQDCCIVYAPHYRQATLAAYWKTEGGFPARSVAYSDVKRAFEQFLAEGPADAPFLIAGHSQGAEHGLRLLQEKIAGKDLQKRLVAAYLIGTPIHKESLKQFMPGIPVCDAPDATGCLIAWSTFKETTSPEKFFSRAVWPQESGYHNVSGEFVCVNPVSWLLDGQMTSLDQHRGARLKKNPGLKIRARCENSVLLVDDVDAWLELSLGGNYHLDDFALFYYDIQENVRTRRDAFLNAHKGL